MTLYARPPKLTFTEEEWKSLMKKFEEHEISKENKERQEKFREQIRSD